MRTRAYRRHQRARIKAAHLRAYHELMSLSELPPPKDIAVRHPLDCGRHCLMCHMAKFTDPRRAREKRAWRREV